MEKRKVYIENPNASYQAMFQREGWELVDNVLDADLVQFTGGADVSPSLYNQVKHEATFAQPDRDTKEIRLFELCRHLNKPMAGICRGGQFLNVMSGGSMYQHVDGHAISTQHMVMNVKTGGLIPCTSTHHQMMRPAKDAEIIGLASEATFYEIMSGNAKALTLQVKDMDDTEVVYYNSTHALCFQPHPEYLSSASPCRKWYMELIEEYLMDDIPF